MNNLKPLVNDKTLWEAFQQELDNRLNETHRAMEQTDSTNSLYRLQGQTIAIRKLKQLREYVNA